ncbi:thioester domain-containing protein [Cellulomonas cellasea]|nr:thioester domain-containing protein [Cellulomonas cellasea]
MADPATAEGQAVNGFLPPVGTPFDPTAGYPTSDPAGYDVANEGFAGIIRAIAEDTGTVLSMYCIDIRTTTFSGLGYTNGTWDESTVPNVGYIARILNSYYPTVPTEPATPAGDNERAAAVQAAIWFFSDGFVVATSDMLNPIVATIVAEVLAAGPLPEPASPDIAITPASASGAVGSLVGPFTVTAATTTGPAPSITLSVPTGVTAYSDAAGTVEVPDGSTVASGTQIWVRGATAGAVSLGATATVEVPTGNVYLYDQSTPGVDAAQKLILAQTANIKADATAAIELFATGALVVDKTVAGGAAGAQGEVVLDVACTLDGATVLSESVVIPAESEAGTTSTRFDGIQVDSECSVTEPTTGETTAIEVTTTNTGAVTIAADADARITVTNTYEVRPGSLVVTKVIAGTAAGSQGQVELSVQCVQGQATVLSELVVIEAGQGAGDTEASFTGIPSGSVCTVTEPTTGETATVAVTTDLPDPVTISATEGGELLVTNTYDARPGTLVVSKTITGAGAGAQGAVELTVECVSDGSRVLSERVTLPAGASAGTTSQTFTGVPANSVCSVTEPATGATATVRVTVSLPASVTIAAGATSTLAVTNTYTKVSSGGGTALAATGSDSPLPLGGLTIGLLTLGLALVDVSRRWANRRG